MIKDGIEYTKCPACERICLKLEITSYGICKDCLIEKMKNCENCADSVEYATCAPMDGKPRVNESPLQKVKGCRLCGECKDKNLWRIKS